MIKNGRPPVPTALKVIRGNPGKRPLNSSEPRPAVRIPPAPPHLGAEGKREWRRMTRELYKLGLVTSLDVAALAAYCGAWERYVDASAKVRDSGAVLFTKDRTALYQNPYVGVANKAADLMLKIGAEFGMTPASRTRIQATPPTAPDAFAEFLG